MASAKEGGEKMILPSVKSLTRKHTINSDKHVHGVDVQEACPLYTQIRNFAMKEMGTPGVRTDTRIKKAV
ncbi:60S ribosomal protein L31 [Vulpes lagopus]